MTYELYLTSFSTATNLHLSPSNQISAVSVIINASPLEFSENTGYFFRTTLTFRTFAGGIASFTTEPRVILSRCTQKSSIVKALKSDAATNARIIGERWSGIAPAVILAQPTEEKLAALLWDNVPLKDRKVEKARGRDEHASGSDSDNSDGNIVEPPKQRKRSTAAATANFTGRKVGKSAATPRGAGGSEAQLLSTQSVAVSPPMAAITLLRVGSSCIDHAISSVDKDVSLPDSLSLRKTLTSEAHVFFSAASNTAVSAVLPILAASPIITSSSLPPLPPPLDCCNSNVSVGSLFSGLC